MPHRRRPEATTPTPPARPRRPWIPSSSLGTPLAGSVFAGLPPRRRASSPSSSPKATSSLAAPLGLYIAGEGLALPRLSLCPVIFAAVPSTVARRPPCSPRPVAIVGRAVVLPAALSAPPRAAPLAAGACPHARAPPHAPVAGAPGPLAVPRCIYSPRPPLLRPDLSRRSSTSARCCAPAPRGRARRPLAAPAGARGQPGYARIPSARVVPVKALWAYDKGPRPRTV